MANWEHCDNCNGSGMGRDGSTSSTCDMCGGDGGYLARDNKGRFTKWATPEGETDE